MCWRLREVAAEALRAQVQLGVIEDAAHFAYRRRAAVAHDAGPGGVEQAFGEVVGEPSANVFGNPRFTDRLSV